MEREWGRRYKGRRYRSRKGKGKDRECEGELGSLRDHGLGEGRRKQDLQAKAEDLALDSLTCEECRAVQSGLGHCQHLQSLPLAVYSFFSI